MSMQAERRQKQSGLSLIELMIAMTLGILIVAGMGTLFVQNKNSYNQGDQIERMQEDARYALNTIIDDIELAGFWADVHAPSNVDRHADATIDGAADCSGASPWVYVAERPVAVHDHNVASVNATFDCIADAAHQDNTDAIAINRVAGAETPLAQLKANAIYMMSNGANGIFLTPATTGTTMGGTIKYWEYKPTLYYVRNYANTAGDGIPTLCRFELSDDVATPRMEETCIAQGVENLQIEYGIDTDTDGVANQYISSPSAILLRDRLVSVRLHLLMRSIEPDHGYTNPKTYSIGNFDGYVPDDNFYRRVYTTTVLVRNTRNLRCVSVGCEEE